MFTTAIAGSLPKPAWLAETEKLWPQWKAQGDELLQVKRDATLLWIKAQEDAGIDVIGDGEQARQHFVHGFVEHVEGIDFVNKVTMGIRNNRYDAQVPQVIAPLRLKGRVHAFEAQLARAHTKKLSIPWPTVFMATKSRWRWLLRSYLTKRRWPSKPMAWISFSLMSLLSMCTWTRPPIGASKR